MRRFSIALTIFILIPQLVFSADLLTVARCIDGDTLQLSNGEKVRLIGVDTPESSSNLKLFRDAKRTGQDTQTILGMGKEAAEFTGKWAVGKQVRLEYDVQKKDKYGRTLAYVYVFVCGPVCMSESEGSRDLEFVRNKQGLYLFLNATIVKAGYAQGMTVPPNVKHQELFVKLEKEARERKKGLWGETVEADPKKSDADFNIEDTANSGNARASNPKTGLDYKVSENATVGVGASRKTNDPQDPAAWEKSSRKGAAAQAKYKLSF
jgi:micrococcal nuclease